MDKMVLASRLVDVANDLAVMAETQRDASGSKIERMASTIIAFQLGPEIAASARAVSELAQAFKGHHADLIAEIAKMEKAVDEKRDLLKAYYQDWKKTTGYEKARREMLGQAATCMQVGEVLTDLADDMTVVKRESENESFKEKYNILVSTLNEAELNKFRKILDSFFRKQITELKTGVEQLDGQVKAWHESAQAIADERGITLPKASDDGARQATALDSFADILKKIVPDLQKRLQGWVRGLWTRITRNTSELNRITQGVMAMADKAKVVLAS
jgi:hypothetical protein